MGSTGYFGCSAAEAVASELRGSEVIRKAWVGSTVYAAVRHPKGYVFACVLTVRRFKDETVVKTMDESMEPFYYDCPATVFAALTPIEEIAAITGSDQAFARVWREKVAERLARRKAARSVTPGTTVRFAKREAQQAAESRVRQERAEAARVEREAAAAATAALIAAHADEYEALLVAQTAARLIAAHADEYEAWS